MAPRSILKNSTVSTNGPPVERPVNQRHMETALHHANIIEQRKIVEQKVLENVIVLMDFPTSSDADPTRPSPADALLFRELMLPFQPSDYDALIEERNIAELCGYALCPRPRRKARTRAKKQFVMTDSGPEIVDKKLLEIWCSDDCAKRALYVKVQLNENPAWMRQDGYGDKVELMVENAAEHTLSLPIRLKKEAAPVDNSKSDEDEDAAAAWAARDDALADLAMERGEKPGRLTKANKDLISKTIRERVGHTAPVAPSLEDQISNAHMAIEGHIPRTSRPQDDDDDEDANEIDWDKHLPT
ncbi:hypothetical protein P154DRAFT_523798 [Amniculicola lignicola CBS 123094]|uniref:RNA polymerase II subunit B1 CTD phosphatase RPAP2 homolog n=1 Tax=Amniculicola lignicola CBS 123094 TaxID=1392246 RepID=A0A6A5WA24_9PLEO|nr:hypothetical protein P154DRAFT_523798 [Amniculicola lignicola CBS 123094]